MPASRTCLSDFLFFYVLCLLFVFPLPGKTVSTAIVLNEQRWGSTSEVLIFTFYLLCDNRHTSLIFPFFRIFLNLPTQSLLSAESGFWCGVRMIVWVIIPDVFFFFLISILYCVFLLEGPLSYLFRWSIPFVYILLYMENMSQFESRGQMYRLMASISIYLIR